MVHHVFATLLATLLATASSSRLAPTKDKSKPRLSVSSSFEPIVKLRKKASVFGTTFTLGADLRVNDRLAVRATAPRAKR